jgi:hypothetical protein
MASRIGPVVSLIAAEDRELFRENGYVKIPNAVPEENCQAAIDAIWECPSQDPAAPETWYDPPEGMAEHWDSRLGGFVKLFHHQSVWDNRQHPVCIRRSRSYSGRNCCGPASTRPG